MCPSAILLALLATTNDQSCDCLSLQEQVTKLEAEISELRRVHTLVSTDGVGKTRWGMSRAQVKRKYSEAQEADEGLARKIKIANLDAIQLFIFTQDKLSIVGVLFSESYTNKNHHLADYQKLQKLLEKKYGKALSTNTYWSQDLYRKNPKYIGRAVSKGDVQFISKWQTEKTDIELALFGNNFDVSLRIRYASRELKELQQQQNEADNLSDL